ncbi:hypothetical protein SISSUDRAFT_1065486 [Sistotremastrum suecicum HHB10207 ss-3]|uniref:Symplekin n=1 Tax=Sistotremastrum suecicum HHB10207 ss-3 TaxID=1314776 RepID=A0A165ZF81_9AGAM|nr:hypothetical protein SISSUDRAFT_1065486 [Sistotremastrum suecicum HHB10207 ss-3]
MAAPVDPIQLFSAAINDPPNSAQQAQTLATLREALESQPNRLPMFLSTLVGSTARAENSLLKSWMLDLLHYALSQTTLNIDARTQCEEAILLASSSLDVLESLLNEGDVTTCKVVIQCFASVYPLLFRLLCLSRQQPSARSQWETVSRAKARILDLVGAPGVNIGLKLAALKFMQRVILVQTRNAVDPRLQSKNDPNLSQCPTDHPFLKADQLEQEGVRLLQQLVTILFTSQSVDLISAIVNGWASLVEHRPIFLPFIVQTLVTWTPNALAASPSNIRSVEKTIKIMLVYISKKPQAAPHMAQINAALGQQAMRLEQLAQDERNRRAEASRKRSLPASEETGSDPKRPKMENQPEAGPSIASVLSSFDFRTLPAALIIELIIANLTALSATTLQTAVANHRQTIRSQAPADPSQLPNGEAAVPVAEPVDPLKMEIDDELDYKLDRLDSQLEEQQDPAHSRDGNAAVGFPLNLTEFAMPPPRALSESEREVLVKSSLLEMQHRAEELLRPNDKEDDSKAAGLLGKPLAAMSSLFLVRIVSRGLESPFQDEAISSSDLPVQKQRQVDRLRQSLCDFVLDNFPARAEFATMWMNEEWYNDRTQSAENPSRPPVYDVWLQKIVSGYRRKLDGKDKSFSAFLLDLPHISSTLLELLRELMSVGFTTLRELVATRPPVRSEALCILLELTTHPEKVPRNAAIITLKRWVPDVQPMDGLIREFARQMLRRLEKKVSQEPTSGAGDNATEEDGQLPAEALVQTPYLPVDLHLPAEKPQVLQYVELLFALSVKAPDLLDDIFAGYSRMDVSVQEALQDLLTPLIRSLGSGHGKLLTLLRNIRRGAESLALRVITIFTENGRPSAPLVALVKALIAERNLDARFLMPIIGEMDKADIIRHLPRVVATLNGTAEQKNIVRSVFTTIISTPSENFGTVSSNEPRVRHSELLTPAELMILLHQYEKEIGLKSAMEGIGICFSMTEVFRSEILAVVMQQIVDEPVLPVLFLRTVIQAVTTYKSLVGFVSTTLLSRLVTKRIWINPPLWEGFIRCAKAIAPASFGALVQLPKEQLREIVDKQPSLKAGLREFVLKKSGNKAKVAGFLDIFNDETPSSTESSVQRPQTPTQPPIPAVSSPTAA